MKYLETTFDEYIISKSNTNIKDNYKNTIKKLPLNIDDLNNIILYGPPGVGKYTESLNIIKKYSANDLKYERKLTIQLQKKQTYITKISDIHFEVDFELLGCNAKLLWSEIYSQIIDIITSKKNKAGIILCKNFHKIHDELLDNFYNYMHQNNPQIIIKYIIITEQISFLPKNIHNICNIFNYSKKSLIEYKKIQKNKYINIDKYEIKNNKIEDYTKYSNIKDIKLFHKNFANEYDILTDITVDFIMNSRNNNIKLDFMSLRDNLYNILIYQLDIYKCISTIVNKVLKKIKIKRDLIIDLQIELNKFLKYYNNNYRPIFHLEKIIVYLCKIVNECE